MDLTTLDYAAQDAKQKETLLRKLNAHLADTAKTFTFRQKILAQGLFVNRISHFLAAVCGELTLPLPKLSADLLALVWQYLSGERSVDEIEPEFRALDSVVVCLMTGDDEELDEAAWETYQAEWDNHLYSHTCMDSAEMPCYLLEDIVSGDSSWSMLVSGALLDSLGGFISDFDLDPVFRTPDGAYRGKEIFRHYREIYDSPTFAGLFAALQDDLRAAKSVKDSDFAAVQQLFAEYETKTVFSSEQVEKIAGVLKDEYHM